MSLPTTPGPYWWRAKAGDEWEMRHVEQLDNEILICRIDRCDYEPVVYIGGQWAKAHNPDEGVEAWVVFNPRGAAVWAGPTEEYAISTATGPSESGEFYNKSWWQDAKKLGFTCKPVTIYRKEKE